MSEILNPLREKIVATAVFGVDHHDQYNYTEGPQRWEWRDKPPFTLPWDGDCSAHVTYCYWVNGAPDPNGYGYAGGYTGTLLAHCEHIPLEQVLPGDIIVYGPGTGWHTALVIEPGPDPLTISMGQQGDPSYVRVSQDGREPQTYLRAIPPYVPNPVKPRPCPNKKFPPPPGHPPLVIYGHPASGAWVSYLQTLLGQRVTGKYDIPTLIALTAFQSDHGHPATGMVSPDTWAKLGVI